MPTTSEVNGVPSFFSKWLVAFFTYLNPMYSSGMLQYAIRIFAKSDRSQREPRSMPAILVNTPNAITMKQSTRIKLMKDFFWEILLAQISVKEKILTNYLKVIVNFVNAVKSIQTVQMKLRKFSKSYKKCLTTPIII